MPFITQGKTNWKFLLIVVILVVIIGGGILIRLYNRSYIKVISPNGGEIWEIGKTYEVRWEFRGPKDTAVLITLIDYTNPERPKDEAFAGTLPHISASAEKYSWTIPTDFFGREIIPGEKYKIYIEENAIKYFGLMLWDEGDNYFSIVKKDETADWQTYRNEGYGFEVKYPKDWTFNEDVMSFNFTSGTLMKGSDELSCSLNIAVATKGTNAEYINSLPQEKWQKSEININRESATKLVSKDSPILAHYFLENNGGDYAFQIYHNTTRYITNQEGYKVASGYVYNQECMNIFNQILSTFNFID